MPGEQNMSKNMSSLDDEDPDMEAARSFSPPSEPAPVVPTAPPVVPTPTPNLNSEDALKAIAIRTFSPTFNEPGLRYDAENEPPGVPLGNASQSNPDDYYGMSRIAPGVNLEGQQNMSFGGHSGTDPSGGQKEPTQLPIIPIVYGGGSPGRVIKGGRDDDWWQNTTEKGIPVSDRVKTLMEDSYIMQQAATAAHLAAAKQQIDQERQFAAQQAARLEADAAEKQRIQTMRKQAFDAAVAKQMQRQKAASTLLGDDEGEQILGVLGLMLSTYGAVRNKVPNFAMSILEQKAQARAADYERGDRELQRMVAQWDTEDQKKAAITADYYKAAQVKLEELMSGVKDKEAQANAGELMAQLNDKYAAALNTIGMTEADKVTLQDRDIKRLDKFIPGTPARPLTPIAIVAQQALAMGQKPEDVQKRLEQAGYDKRDVAAAMLATPTQGEGGEGSATNMDLSKSNVRLFVPGVGFAPTEADKKALADAVAIRNRYTRNVSRMIKLMEDNEVGAIPFRQAALEFESLAKDNFAIARDYGGTGANITEIEFDEIVRPMQGMEMKEYFTTDERRKTAMLATLQAVDAKVKAIAESRGVVPGEVLSVPDNRGGVRLVPRFTGVPTTTYSDKTIPSLRNAKQDELPPPGESGGYSESLPEGMSAPWQKQPPAQTGYRSRSKLDSK